MSVRSPHFLLFSEARRHRNQPDWRFVLEAADGSAKLEAADNEPHMGGERLELLAIVRGLEALDQPSHVTIFTPSRYVHRGLRFGLPEWRSSGWQWERYGQMVPIKDQDLWQRVDRALEFHRVECRSWRIDEPHTEGESADATTAADRVAMTATPRTPLIRHSALEDRSDWTLQARRAWLRFRRWAAETFAAWQLRASQFRSSTATQLLLGKAISD